MRILFLQQQPCMRSLKYAVGLRSTGRRLELGFACQGRTLSEWYGTGDDLFDRWWRLGPEPAQDLARVVSEFRPDMIHSHNLPDRLTVTALDVSSGAVPVVHDVHDLQSLRQTPYEDGFPEPEEPLMLEKAAVQGCDALVVVSAEMLEAIDARHGRSERSLVFANYAVARNLPSSLPAPERPLGRPLRLVYQGTLSTNGGHYDLREVFGRLVAGGASLDVYPGRPAPVYETMAAAIPGLRCHPTLSPAHLLERLPAYDFGWAGFNASLNRAHLDTALPNKVFEYIGCGLPVLTLDHRALRRLIEEEGVGVPLEGPDEIAAQLEAVDVVDLRRHAAAVRQRLTVEANIGRITDLYDGLSAR